MRSIIDIPFRYVFRKLRHRHYNMTPNFQYCALSDADNPYLTPLLRLSCVLSLARYQRLVIGPFSGIDSHVLPQP